MPTICRKQNMFGLDVLLGLPVEIACEIGLQWLSFKDIVRLDSACCELSKRRYLHEQIFQSPLFVAQFHNRVVINERRFRDWFCKRLIRTDSVLYIENVINFEVQVESVKNFEDYLRMCGESIKYLVMYSCTELYEGWDQTMLSTFKLCPNIRSIECTESSVYDAFFQLLRQCKQLEHVILDDVSLAPLTDTLEVKILEMYSCKESVGENFMNALSAEHLQQLRLTKVPFLHGFNWDRFSNLHTLRCGKTRSTDHALYFQILSQCPSIVHVDWNESFLDKRTLGKILRTVHNLRTLNIERAVVLDEDSDDSGDKEEASGEVLPWQKHANSLEALYTHWRRALPWNSKNSYMCDISAALKLCPRLHTISYAHHCRCNIEHSLMGNITTIITDMGGVCKGMVQHCHNLKHLHIIILHHDRFSPVTSFTNLTRSASGLPALHTLHLLPVKSAQQATYDALPEMRATLKAARPAASVVIDRYGAWYDVQMPV